jgi:hypothetical protein
VSAPFDRVDLVRSSQPRLGGKEPTRLSHPPTAIAHLLLRMCWPPLLGAPRYLLPVYPAFLTMGKWAEKMKRTHFAFLCGALFAFNLVWMWAFLSWSLVL